MKARRIFMLLLVCVVMVSVLGVPAFATASTPYDSYYVTITDGSWKDTATATINRCKCLPVNNYLKAGILVQYKSGDNYYWNPSEGMMNVDTGTNVEYCSKSISVANIVYAYGEFHARCGTGDEKIYVVRKTHE